MATNLNRLRTKLQEAQALASGETLKDRYEQLIYSAYSGMQVPNRRAKTLLVLKYAQTVDEIITLMQELAYI